GDDPRGEAGGGVDAGAHRGAAERELGEPRQGGLDPGDAVAHLGGVAAELLPQGDRGGVHEVGAAGLDDVGELLGLAFQGAGEGVERGQQVADHGGGGGDVDGGGEDVVGRLRGVDVVVRVHRPAQDRAGDVGDDLVGVHVRRRAG